MSIAINEHYLRISSVVVTASFLASACGGAAGSSLDEASDQPAQDDPNNDSYVDSTGPPNDPTDPSQVNADQVGADRADAESGSIESATVSTSDNHDDDQAPVASDFLDASDTRAMWVWDESPSVETILNNTDGAQDDLLEFAAAPHDDTERAINRLFFAARSHADTDPLAELSATTYDPLTDAAEQPKLRDFLTRANARGIAVEYLDGQPLWLASDANAAAAKQVCRDVAAFNQSTDDPTERFAGIHLDIEPHTVRSGPFADQWWQNKLPGGYNDEWTARWKDILNSCRTTIDAYEATTGDTLTLASDIGTDYARFNQPLVDFLNRPDSPVDYLTIMNYFDNRPNADGDPSYFYGDDGDGQMCGGVVENLASWDELPLVFAFETGPTSIAPDQTSFHQEGYDAMYATMDELLADYAADNLIGVGIHHYSPQSFRDMKQ